MAFRQKLLVLASAFLGLASPANAAGLSAINAFSCAGQGTGIASTSKRSGWAPEYYRAAANAYSAPRDTASTVKLRIIYDMGDRVEIDHCGGTVIDANWVVTAGHCVAADRSWDRVEIVAGDEHLDGAEVIKRTTREAVCHAGFRYETLENDIALLHIEKPLPARITPTALDFEGTPSLGRGDLGIGHGWPVTGMRAGDRFLNQTHLQVHDIDLRSYITVTNASGPVGGMCRGESGGPILSNGRYGRRLAGVLSGIQPGTENAAGEECMLGNYEMYFTPIAAHRRWIDNVKSLCTGNPTACGRSGSAAMSYVSAAPKAQPQYVSYQQQTTKPAYQTVAYVAPEPTYIDVGNAFAYASPAPMPAQPYYQPVAPTYVDTGMSYGTMAPIYDDRQAYVPAAPAYQPAPASHYGGYNIAYVQPPIIFGSMYPHHAQ
jgi:hypothetical protein